MSGGPRSRFDLFRGRVGGGPLRLRRHSRRMMSYRKPSTKPFGIRMQLLPSGSRFSRGCGASTPYGQPPQRMGLPPILSSGIIPGAGVLRCSASVAEGTRARLAPPLRTYHAGRAPSRTSNCSNARQVLQGMFCAVLKISLPTIEADEAMEDFGLTPSSAFW